MDKIKIVGGNKLNGPLNFCDSVRTRFFFCITVNKNQVARIEIKCSGNLFFQSCWRFRKVPDVRPCGFNRFHNTIINE